MKISLTVEVTRSITPYEGNTKKHFKLKDLYNGYVIGYYDTIAEVTRAALAYNNDCEGDWLPQLRELNPKTGLYAVCNKEF